MNDVNFLSRGSFTGQRALSVLYFFSFSFLALCRWLIYHFETQKMYLLYTLFLIQLCYSTAINLKSTDDFVASVSCHAQGMDVKLKDRLPPPRNGMWTLEVEDHPSCPNGAAKTDVGGGYEFTIFYADKDLCGVQPVSWFTPNWLSYAETTLVLNDANGTKIADSISCIYNTRFDASLLTFKGEATSENLRYGGSLDDEGTDVETVVDSGKAVNMDFYENDGSPLASNRKVKLGDQLLFRIDVSSTNHVSRILPETCYFSSSSQPDENLINGQTLPFVKKNCFNWKNGMVKAFLQPMERNSNGTLYQLAFPAFYFTDYGRNLYVHCTILACIGDQKLCEPNPNCFGTNRRRRQIENDQEISTAGKSSTHEYILTRALKIESRGPQAIIGTPVECSMMFLSISGTILGTICAAVSSILTFIYVKRCFEAKIIIPF